MAFPNISIDPDSPVPLYFQVESDLRRLIETGRYQPGESLPPELDLCRQYAVSRQTMRMALTRLAADDLISRSPGRGTFVLSRNPRSQVFLDRSFTQQMAEMGRTAHSRILAGEVSAIGPSDPEALQQYRGAPAFRLTRLRFGDEEPVGIQHATILTSSCPGIETLDFESQSLYDVLARTYQLPVHEIRHTVTAVSAGNQEAALLHVESRSPLLVVHTTALLRNEEIIEYTTSFYRTDRYEYSTRHTL